MNWKKHLLFGALIFLLINFFYFYNSVPFNYFDFIVGISIIMVYSILPDIDHPLSNITWIFILSSILMTLLYFLENNFLFIYLGISLLIFIFLTAKVCKHRGRIHSIIVGVLFSMPLYFIGINFFFYGFIGYLSHLILDKEIKIL